ncbi:APC family permease [Streptomyces sp. BK340]|uniref:APC family permease n=1 Tax=Streptomyces sp. BK340 TaxID=2572903 RepID=UPI0011ABCBDF|nr:APC family permease [Streptomyces sp. BK340]TVZ84892.1 amino acid/polyamine/organocation transporter (APC superfamily) [Streptomyces sp. BK340]
MSQPPASSSEPRRHGLSLIDVVAQSVGFMGPVFSVSILLPLLIGVNAAGRGAGVAAPLAVLLATVGMLALGWIVSAYARRVKVAGSLYNYVTLGLGRRAGAAAGLMYYAGVLLLGAAIGPLVGGYLHDNLLAEFHIEPLPVWGWQLLLLAGLVAVVHVGVEFSVRTQLVLSLISVGVLLVFFIYVIVAVGHDNSAKAFNPGTAHDGWSGILFAVLYGVLLFTGFEAAANLAEEAKDPHRHIPKAVFFSVLAAAVFFLIGTYAQVAGFHFDLSAMTQAAGAPLNRLAGGGTDGYGSTTWGRLVELVIFLDMVAVYIGVAVSATRGVLTMARDGWLPRPLASVSARQGTPAGSTVLIGVVYVAVIAMSGFFPKLLALPGAPAYLAVYSWFSTFGIFCLAAIYLMMAVGAPRGLRGQVSRPLVWLCCTVGALLTAGALFDSVYRLPAPTLYAAYAALSWFAAAVVIALVVGRRQARIGDDGTSRLADVGGIPS